MTRSDAISILAQRLADAPNHADYLLWLHRQPDEMLFALAQGKDLPFSRIRELAA